MSPDGFAHDLQVALELVGIYVFATAGSLLAVRKGFDAVGLVVLAEVTALGGGVVRDLIIDAGPPAAFSNAIYLVIPLIAAVVTFFAHPVVERLRVVMLTFDAAGLSLFAVAGTLKALEYDFALLPAILLGVTTAVGGGLLRDVIARETPELIKRDSDLYSIPAAVGATLVALTHQWDSMRVPLAIGAAVLTFLFRCAAMMWHWHAPPAWERRRPARSE